MCTLTIIPWRLGDQPAGARGIRVSCNRDESRLRPAALPPRVRIFGSRSACLPIDPVSDGTWIAANDAGLVFVLMNVYVEQSRGGGQTIASAARPSTVSRGRIIPAALAAGDLDEARSIVESLDHDAFEPFRLLVADREQLAEFVWSEGEFRDNGPKPIERPVFFTSSGLGDDVVATPRRKLFEEFFADGQDWPARQDAFHRNVWPGNQGASVWMTRPEAMTVSITQIELAADRVTMRYFARVGDSLEVQAAEPISLAIAAKS